MHILFSLMKLSNKDN